MVRCGGGLPVVVASSTFVFLLLGCQLFICEAYESNRVQEDEKESLRCYDCNSEYDPRCGDPFNPYTIGVINCTDRKPPEALFEENEYVKPVVCRKLVQKVEGRTRVVRGCGYLRDDKDDKACVIRSGTMNVNVAYCACTTTLCNTGHYQERPTFRIIMLTAFITLGIESLLLHLAS